MGFEITKNKEFSSLSHRFFDSNDSDSQKLNLEEKFFPKKYTHSEFSAPFLMFFRKLPDGKSINRVIFILLLLLRESVLD